MTWMLSNLVFDLLFVVTCMHNCRFDVTHGRVSAHAWLMQMVQPVLHLYSTVQYILCRMLRSQTSCESEALDGNIVTFVHTVNPLTPDLPQYGVPRPGALRHNIICNSFFSKFQPDISALRE